MNVVNIVNIVNVGKTGLGNREIQAGMVTTHVSCYPILDFFSEDWCLSPRWGKAETNGEDLPIQRFFMVRDYTTRCRHALHSVGGTGIALSEPTKLFSGCVSLRIKPGWISVVFPKAALS